MKRPAWMVLLALLLSCTDGSQASGLEGLSRPFRRVPGWGAVLPRFDGGQLPGHVVGVLQWDPDTIPGQRLVLLAGGRVWSTLFVPNPADRGPIKFPLGDGTTLDLAEGVRLLQLTDVRVAHLPALVEVTVNQGHGVRGTNAMLAACRPIDPGTWSLPLAPLVGACTRDWQAQAAALAPAPDAKDVVMTGWDASAQRLEIVVLRKHRNRITRTRDRTDPLVVRRGQPIAVARYEVDAHDRVVEKVLAVAP